MPFLNAHPVKRFTGKEGRRPISRALHGFCDASTKVYGGVVYLWLLYEDASVSTHLLLTKS